MAILTNSEPLISEDSLLLEDREIVDSRRLEVVSRSDCKTDRQRGRERGRGGERGGERGREKVGVVT